MWRATIRGIFARKVRLILTMLAIILGVAYISGSFVLTDTLKESFGQVYGQFSKGSELIITASRSGANGDGGGGGAFGGRGAVMAAAALPVVQGTPGVRAATGIAQSDSVVFIDKRGNPIAGGVKPTLGISWPTADAGPFQLRAGRAPTNGTEVAMDAATADAEGFIVGDTVDVVVGSQPRKPYQLVGLIGLGTATDLGGVTYGAFDLATAEQLFNRQGVFDLMFVRTEPGASIPAVAQALRAALGPQFTVLESGTYAAQLVGQVKQAVGFINDAILGFAALGMFVGAFVIANTFVILIQQRTRELALLRMLGASGRSIVVSVILEALIVGFVASVMGFVAGIGVALLALKVLPAVGLPIPGGTAIILTRTAVISIGIGVVVTVVSAIWPAWRAASISPMAALTEVRPRPSKPFLRPKPLDPPPVSTFARVVRIVAGVVAALVAVPLAGSAFNASTGATNRGIAAWLLFWIVLIALALFSRAISRFVFSRLMLGIEFTALGIAYIALGLTVVVGATDAVRIVGIGALTLFIGVVIGTALVARPIARVLGTRPVGVLATAVGAAIVVVGLVELAQARDGSGAALWSIVTAVGIALAGFALVVAGPALFGTIGLLARGNAMRNPRRTATTAAALIIGLSLICVVSVFASSVKQNVTKSIETGLRADLILNAPQFSGFSGNLETQVRALPETQAAVALRYGNGGSSVNGSETSIAAVTTAGLGEVLDVGFTQGSYDGLTRNGILVSTQRAKDLNLKVGDTVPVTFAGLTLPPLTVVGIYSNDQFTGAQPAEFIIDQALVNQGGDDGTDNVIYVRAKPGQADALRPAVDKLLATYPTVVARDLAQFQRRQLEFVSNILNIFFGLLAVAVLEALLGIINTLLLSVYERTRELGLLRAIGTTRVQIRRMIRGEAVIIAVLGSALGLALGLVWAWAFVKALGSTGINTFSVPWQQLGGFVALSAAAAVLAAVIPAWRAGQLNILEAIAEE